MEPDNARTVGFNEENVNTFFDFLEVKMENLNSLVPEYFIDIDSVSLKGKR